MSLSPILYTIETFYTTCLNAFEASVAFEYEVNILLICSL